jgi:hypothetical protein
MQLFLGASFLMHRGYIKIYRKINESWIWRERNKNLSKFEAWVDLLLRANFKEGNEFCVDNQIIKQIRGEVFTSQMQLAIDWNWTRNKVKSFLDLLQRDEKITYKPSNKYTKIYITNYGKYNPIDENKNQQIEQQGNTNKTVNKQLTNTINNNKKDNNINKYDRFIE